jgi:hypothetical protein
MTYMQWRSKLLVVLDDAAFNIVDKEWGHSCVCVLRSRKGDPTAIYNHDTTQCSAAAMERGGGGGGLGRWTSQKVQFYPSAT